MSKAIIIMAFLAVFSAAATTVGNCSTEAVLVKNALGNLYAFTFEGEECLGTSRNTALSTPKGKFNAQRDKRIANASLYLIQEPGSLKEELCSQAVLKGQSIPSPIGKITAINYNEPFARRNGCVAAMRMAKGLYLDASEIRLFASPFLEAVYSLGNCASINVCGVGLVTAAHCIPREREYTLTGFWDRSLNETWLRLQEIDRRQDYAIFPQMHGQCVKPAAASVKDEILYVLTRGDGGDKMATVTRGEPTQYNPYHIQFDITTMSFGDSGSGIINSKGEYVGTEIAIQRRLNAAIMVDVIQYRKQNE